MNYYNEHDERAAAWLRELIDRSLIAPGLVDTRSIEDVTPNDLRHFKQCHFFAGIGVWSYALRRAGWPDDRRVWTGSCPCQPFSAAGKGDGFADERHLWPAWLQLIAQCRPDVVFGEQVASKDGLGWLDLVCADMEAAEYAFGAVDLCAAGVGAPQIRQRLFFVADADLARLEGWAGVPECAGERAVGPNGLVGGLADDDDARRVEHAQRHGETLARCGAGELGDDASRRSGLHAQQPGPTNGHWRDADWLYCTDARWRPVEPGTFPLAHGAPERVGRLRGYGNAIVAQVAQAFIESYLECLT